MARGRGAGLPAFQRHMTNLLGRPPTQAEIAAAITLTESNPITGAQDKYDILGAIYNRSRLEGGIDQRAYDGVAYRRGSGVGSGHFSKITKENLKPLVERYTSWETGKGKPNHPHTHYFHPSAMRAIYNRNPGMVRSSKWRTVVFGDDKVTSPMPSWLNPKEAYFSGKNKHVGLFTTPKHLARHPNFMSSAEGLAPPLPAQRSSGTEKMLAQLLEGGIPEAKDTVFPEGAATTASNMPAHAPEPGQVSSVPMPKKHDWSGLPTTSADTEIDVGTNTSIPPKGIPADTPEQAWASKGTTYQVGPPSRHETPKRASWGHGEDLSAPPAHPAPPPLPVSSGPTPPALRPDQTSDWVKWQHGQMQGALNTGPTQYVPPGGPPPVKPVNMNLSNLLGGLKFW